MRTNRAPREQCVWSLKKIIFPCGTVHPQAKEENLTGVLLKQQKSKRFPELRATRSTRGSKQHRRAAPCGSVLQRSDQSPRVLRPRRGEREEQVASSPTPKGLKLFAPKGHQTHEFQSSSYKTELW